MFSKKGSSIDNVVLVENKKVISSDKEISQTFTDFFKTSVQNLGINENKFLLSRTSHFADSLETAIHKFRYHPSIIEIKEKVTHGQLFEFQELPPDHIKTEIGDLKTKKANTFLNIPTQIIKKQKMKSQKLCAQFRTSKLLVQESFRQGWNRQT